MLHRFMRGWAIALVLSMGVLGFLPTDAEAARASAVVMTRNLYLGANLQAAIASPDAEALAQAAADIYVNVQATGFAERAELIAQEIDDTSPDLIGLQEVALWRTGALELAPPLSPATDVAFDFLELLQAELAARGLDYETAVVFEGFDAEVPASFSSSGVPVLRDVRLTQRNVILVRSGIHYSNVRSGQFATNLVFPDVGGIPGNDLVDVRGWVSIDVSMDRRPFRFVNTHLDSFFAPVRTAQAQELVDGPLATNLKIVAVGDFNSPPVGEESGAYQVLTSRSDGKMNDAWTAANGAAPGLTCCQQPDLTNPTSVAYTRIDLILTNTSAVKTEEAFIVGATATTAGGLWASDHFGVVAILLIP